MTPMQAFANLTSGLTRDQIAGLLGTMTEIELAALAHSLGLPLASQALEAIAKQHIADSNARNT